MIDLFQGMLMLMWVMALAQLLAWAISAFIRSRDNKRAREFLENQLLAEAEALRAVTRNREASQAVLRG